MPKVLLIGNQCYDQRDSRLLQGGPAMYQIPVLLGLGWEVEVITRVSEDYPFPSHESLTIHNLSGPDTIFRYHPALDDASDDRVMTLQSVGYRITKLPDSVDSKYDGVIVSGIADEISLSMVQDIPTRIPADIYCLDLQTLSREVAEGQETIDHPISGHLLADLTSLYHLIKGSTIEIGADIASTLPYGGYVVETSGSASIKVYHDKVRTYAFNPIHPTVIDGTGSGDIFLAGLLHAKYLDLPLEEMVAFAHHLAARFLDIRGIPSITQAAQRVADF